MGEKKRKNRTPAAPPEERPAPEEDQTEFFGFVSTKGKPESTLLANDIIVILVCLVFAWVMLGQGIRQLVTVQSALRLLGAAELFFGAMGVLAAVRRIRRLIRRRRALKKKP